MRIVLQRVTKGSVTVDQRVTGSIENGFVALVGITHADTRAEADLLAKKTVNLRVFEDAEGKLMPHVLSKPLRWSSISLNACGRKAFSASSRAFSAR